MLMESSKSSTNSVVDWLASLGLPEYGERFVANAIDQSVLAELTEEDLKELGIPLGHRRKILRAIAESIAKPSLAASSYQPVKSGDGAQRRQLTVMFCDLVGSTALASRLELEDLRDLIGAYHRCVSDTVQGLGGFVWRGGSNVRLAELVWVA